MFAIGVGAALSNANSRVRLRAISGPKAFPEHPLLESDYTAISDFRQLEEALATIGRALCSVRVRVTKLVDEQGDGTYAPANGWNFDGTVTVAGTPNYRWLVPGHRDRPALGRKHADGHDRERLHRRPRPRRLRLEARAHDADEPDRAHGRRQERRRDERLPLRQRRLLEERQLDHGSERRNDHDLGPGDHRLRRLRVPEPEKRRQAHGCEALHRPARGGLAADRRQAEGEERGPELRHRRRDGRRRHARGLRGVHEPGARRTLRQQLRLQTPAGRS